MDYPCGKFGDCSFSRFGFYGADTHTHTHTHTHAGARADDRYTHAIPVGVSNDDTSRPSDYNAIPANTNRRSKQHGIIAHHINLVRNFSRNQ